MVLETEIRRQEMGWLTRDRTGDRIRNRRQDSGDRTVVQETEDFVLRWDWETGDRRLEIEDWR